MSVDYKQSTSQDNRGIDGLPKLPFNIWVVSTITKSNGMNDSEKINSTTSYSYSGGFYLGKEKDFRGFAIANVTLPDGTLQTHYFLQEESRKGMEYKSQIYDVQRRLMVESKSEFIATKADAYYKIALNSESQSIYDGFETPRITNATYTYDDYGNILQKGILGENGISSDDRIEQYYYTYNTSAWIVDKPSYYQLLSVNPLTWIRQTSYLYDGRATTYPPAFGLLTQKEDLLAGGTNPITKYSYNSHGNLVSTTDPNGAVTKFVYGTRDLTFTFPDQQINALNHTANFTYNLGTGNLVSEIDANGYETKYSYDVFGWIAKAIRPLDSQTFPSAIYEYELDGIAPEKIKISQRETYLADGTLDSYNFYDGLGNQIQQKSETTAGRQIVADTYYDQLGRVSRKSNPYFKMFDANYTAPNATVAFSSINYDALSRVVKT
ncbi:MAG: toxin TcdB middle/N-terminal domain-containing protein, partial [Candidatus Micrarchaeota archaeon]